MTLDFDARPSVVTYMLRAIVPGSLRKAPPFPPLRARWKGTRPDGARLGQFLRLTGLGAERGWRRPTRWPRSSSRLPARRCASPRRASAKSSGRDFDACFADEHDRAFRELILSPQRWR